MKVPSDFFVMSPKVMRHGVIIARFSILKSLLLLAAAAVSMGPLYAVPLDAVGGSRGESGMIIDPSVS